jgi:dTMP kinase
MPDITFLLDMDSKAGRARALARQGGVPDRMESEDDALYENVRQGYLAAAKAEPDRFAVIDAAQSEESVAESIWSTLTSRFHGVFS